MSEPTLSISSCGKWLYQWELDIGKNEKVATFILLVPTGPLPMTHNADIGKCVKMAGVWGFGIVRINFAFSRIVEKVHHICNPHIDPVGPDANLYLCESIYQASAVIPCYGEMGAYLDRSDQINIIIASWARGGKIMMFGRTTGGYPLSIKDARDFSSVEEIDIPQPRKKKGRK